MIRVRFSIPPVTPSPRRPVTRPNEPRTRRGESHSSRPSESDRDLFALEDDGNLPSAGQRDHSLELFFVVLDVDVDEGNLPLGVVLTGRRRVGSGVLSKNLDAFHAFLPPHLMANGEVRRAKGAGPIGPGCYDFRQFGR